MKKSKPQSEIVFKVVFRELDNPTDSVLYGLILEENENFLKLQTKKRVWIINKKLISLIETTDRIFEGVKNG